MISRRDELLAKLRTKAFDLLIIGGGIVGAGIARDAAMRGLRVALIEKGDFASGTSSKTSKLIHGGLRYLEQGRVRLVFEGLKERHILRTIAPQLVWPLPLMLPVYRGDPRLPWKIALGLCLYDGLALHWNIRRHRMLSVRETLRRESRLNPDGLRAAASYVDCQMDDARLCLANILQAVSFGAICLNYVRLLAFEQANGTLCGALVEDTRTGQAFEVKASVVVNATGPWSDTVRRLSDRQAGGRLVPTKGSHLIVPRLTREALFFQAHADRRMIFVLPWGDYSLIGTTESTEFDTLDELRASNEEVDYLLAEANRILPEAPLRTTDIVATYAGARPLLAFSGSPRRASREHRIEVDRFGLISVMGGKYTTFRVMAKQTVDFVVKHCRLRAERCLTDQISLLEPVHPVVLDRWQDVTRRIDAGLLGRLLSVYGTGAFRILQLLEFEPSLAQTACPHHDYIQAELVHAMQEELACTVSDLLIRRTKIAYSSCQGLDMLSSLADLLTRYGQVSHEELKEQLEAYHRFLAESLSFSARGGRLAAVPAHDIR